MVICPTFYPEIHENVQKTENFLVDHDRYVYVWSEIKVQVLVLVWQGRSRGGGA